MKKRRTYWLTDHVTTKQRDLAHYLAGKGFDVQFFSNIEALRSEFETKRAGIIVVADEGPKSRVEKFVLTLSNLPEMRSARLILTTTNNYPEVLALSAGGNFRDIIPLNIDNKQWAQRLVFATASKPIDYIQPSGQLVLNGKTTLSMPCRIVWMSGSRIRLECRIKPPIGSTFTLTGALAEGMGVKSISLRVMEAHTDRLRYRFSDAFVALWSVPATMHARSQRVLAELKSHDLGPTCKLFLAVSSSGVRNGLLNKFEDPRFEVNMALQKQSIAQEPKFLSPDAIFIEHNLCVGDNEEIFEQMMDSLTDNVAVIVIGENTDTLEIQHRFGRHRVFGISKIPANLTELMFSKYLGYSKATSSGSDDDACFIHPENKYSFGSVSFPGLMEVVHPTCTHIALPFEVGKFALCMVETPIISKSIGRHPYIKITDVFIETRPTNVNFPYTAQAYFAEMGQTERTSVGEKLLNLMADHLSHFDVRKLPPVERPKPAKAPVQDEAGKDVDDTPPNEATATQEPAASKAASARKLETDVSPVADAAQEVTADIVKGVRTSVKSDTFRHVMIYAAIAAFAAGVIWLVVSLVSPNWSKSGKSYTDSLKKFAPHLNDGNNSTNDENSGN